MEIPATSTSTPAAPARIAEVSGRLASLRALQKAIESAQERQNEPLPTPDGKGQHLDLRC